MQNTDFRLQNDWSFSKRLFEIVLYFVYSDYTILYYSLCSSLPPCIPRVPLSCIWALTVLNMILRITAWRITARWILFFNDSVSNILLENKYDVQTLYYWPFTTALYDKILQLGGKFSEQSQVQLDKPYERHLDLFSFYNMQFVLTPNSRMSDFVGVVAYFRNIRNLHTLAIAEDRPHTLESLFLALEPKLEYKETPYKTCHAYIHCYELLYDYFYS